MKGSLWLHKWAPLVGGALLVFGAGCPSDDNGNGIEPDAEDPDAATDPDADDDPDAAVDVERAGFANVSDVDVVDESGDLVEVGALTKLHFYEEDTGEGLVTYDGDYCTVTQFGAGEYGPPAVDEGAIDIEGTEIGLVGGNGFTCEYNDEYDRYRCTLESDDEATMTIAEECQGIGIGGGCIGDDNVVLTIDGVDLDETHNLEGSWVSVDGFDSASINDGGPYEVLDVSEDGGDTIVQLPEDAVDSDDSTEDGAGDGEGYYRFTIGDEGTSEEFLAIEDGFEFLSGDDVEDQDDFVTVTGQDTTEYLEDFDVSLFPLGQEFVLASGFEGDIPYLQVQDFLTQAFIDDGYHEDEVRFSCDEEAGDEDGDCHEGITDDEIDDELGRTAVVVHGRTTDDDDGDFGDAETRVEFECIASEEDERTAVVSEGALGAILDAEPTFVETNVSYVEAAAASGGDVDVKVGHTVRSVNEVGEEDDE